MTEQEAIELASSAARSAGADLADYLQPHVRFRQGEWIIHFQETRMRVGCFFMAVVDVQSRQVRLSAGA